LKYSDQEITESLKRMHPEAKKHVVSVIHALALTYPVLMDEKPAFNLKAVAICNRVSLSSCAEA